MEPDGIEFATWYADERERVVRSLLVIGGDPEGVRDAVAEAFSRAYERWGRVAGMTSPTGWVYRVALNEIRRRERRRRIESRLLRRRLVPLAMAPPEVDPDLWAAVAALPAREREVIVLRYVAEASRWPSRRRPTVTLGRSWPRIPPRARGSTSAALSP
jgi:DNA-directed RNA polymerase specialized sigma24 family protein